MQQNKSFLTWYHGYANDALIKNERRLVLLSGEESWALSLLTSVDLVSQGLNQNLAVNVDNKRQVDASRTAECLIFGDSNVFTANVLQKRFRDKLGTESEVILFADSKFTIDAFAVLSGTLKAGGICFLIIPSLAEKLAESRFFARFYSLVSEDPNHAIICESEVNKSPEFWSQTQFMSDTFTLDEVNSKTSNIASEGAEVDFSSTTEQQGCITQEQYNAVQAIIKVVSGHRKRPLVLTADRGRGKSSALAIACAQLMKKNEGNDFNLVITAPDIQSLSIFYQQLSQSLLKGERNGNCVTFGKSCLTFVAIDQLIKQPIKCNLLMVDEAAAIPVYMLERLLGLYHRMVFSSTVHGYEGAGRGFTLKFQKTLDSLCPQWNNLHINQPIRWRENDPLEHLVFEACLLNAELSELKYLSELSELTELPEHTSNHASQQSLALSLNKSVSVEKKDSVGRFEFKVITAETLVADEILLKQIFSVLVTAHYQTKPSDLVLLLDNPKVQVVCLISTESNKTAVVAVALLMKEGAAVNVKSKDVFDVKQSKRRLRDHFIPQSLLTHCGFEPAFNYSYLRILRIAVHPELHQKGIGSYFMGLIELFANSQKHDFIGASFGANPELLSFWLKAGFTTVRVGFTKDKASGEHSALVIKGLSKNTREIEQNLKADFYRTFDYLLLDEYKFLASDLTQLMLNKNTIDNLVPMSELDIANVKAYAAGERLFSSCAYSLYLWFKHELLSNNEAANKKELKDKGQVNMDFVLIARLIQKHDINTVCKEYGFTGKKMLNQSIKDYVALSIL